MALRVAINGYGRIGRNVLRAYYEDREQGNRYDLDLVAINDIGQPESLAHLTRYDTTHGRFPIPVALEAGRLQVNGDSVELFHYADPEKCPWKALEIDVVLECTGVFRACADASKHLEAGAERVVIGAVSFDEVDRTIVYGVNHHHLTADDRVISGASCTTHCIAPLLGVLDTHWSVDHALMTEIHAYTSDQHLLDKTHRDVRRARAAAQNLIPTTSSSIGAVQKVLPQLAGRINGYSMRVPTLNVAAIDLTVRLQHTPDPEQLNQTLHQASLADFAGIIGFCDEPLVSSDFIHRTESAIFDATQTLVLGDMVKIGAWYDNEWGYTHRLLDLLSYMSQLND